ncbi:AraC family transcriptional regulator [Mangrovimonas sp. DI 80]|uniref:AraC family transcriptional regulator n=1 Tax=Mangrovimonas sp. DI 80 TaxID=1779330 RepID=UPI0009771C56|nr:AraC family transcriptional regulator [Mangrovimonas sp. DI 80]OMP31917.1 AraC family transcriptional regulator [Mangrovimonas sp. DI 80]
MKVLPFKIPKPEFHSLVYQVDIAPVFYDQLHQHEEFQLSFIVEGNGTLIVGDSVNHYSKGDFLVIGTNLPHVFRSNLQAEKDSHMLSLFFTKASFGKHFFELDELKELHPFFKRAEHGFKVTSNQNQTKNLFLQLEQCSKLNRFLILLELLQLASSSEFKSLSSFVYEKTYTDTEGTRMRDIMEFTVNNYQKDISLEEVSGIAKMTKNAFCKYFKKRTNKSYFTFLNELRIENACRLLQSNKHHTIAEVSYLCGYNNISNFNRQFKNVKTVSPKQFRNTSEHL